MLAGTKRHESNRVFFPSRHRGVDQGVGRCEPEGTLYGSRAGNEMLEQRLCSPSGKGAGGTVGFDFHPDSFFQASGQTDASAGQDHGNVAAADPDILDCKTPALFEKTVVQPRRDFICLKHQ